MIPFLGMGLSLGNKHDVLMFKMLSWPGSAHRVVQGELDHVSGAQERGAWVSC